MLTQYVWQRQTLAQLACEYGRSERWVQRQLERAEPSTKLPRPEPIIAVMDTTYFGRGYGVLVVRCPRRRRNVFWKEVVAETPEDYRAARVSLEEKGYIIEGVVLDGKRGVREVFKDLPVQLCQFHQIQIVKRYLTSRPKTEAGKELRALTLTLTVSTEKTFTELLSFWQEKWKHFLQERTITSDGKHWQYTHRKIRSAYRSLKNNLSHLFTYQRYPQLKIPNTTNSLGGYFGRLKELLRVHRGQTIKHRYKLIQEILRN